MFEVHRKTPSVAEHLGMMLAPRQRSQEFACLFSLPLNIPQRCGKGYYREVGRPSIGGSLPARISTSFSRVAGVTFRLFTLPSA